MRKLRLRAERLRWLNSQGELLALDLRRSSYLAANASGALLWQALADWRTVEDLAQRLVVAYGIDESTARRDVERFLGSLRERDLLEEECRAA